MPCMTESKKLKWFFEYQGDGFSGGPYWVYDRMGLLRAEFYQESYAVEFVEAMNKKHQS